MIISVPQHPILDVSHKFNISKSLKTMTPVTEVFGLTPTAQWFPSYREDFIFSLLFIMVRIWAANFGAVIAATSG